MVLLSFVEGLLVVIMEVFVLGCLVISIYVVGILELVKLGVFGWFVFLGFIFDLVEVM